ncbi:Hypothetical predicted protein, partial [Paramuricea clavata]
MSVIDKASDVGVSFTEVAKSPTILLVFDVVEYIALSNGLLIDSPFTDKAAIPVKSSRDVFWQTLIITLAKSELDSP